MVARIERRLGRIEAEEDARVLLAVESGSRAWGFHSSDSDYDVRFIYVRPVAWHLRLGWRRDVIERPIDDELDLSGWSLGKALGLMMRSNAVVAEWLQSPIVYRADDRAVADLTDFCRDASSRRSNTWHYASLLRRHRSRVVAADGGVRLKCYFYTMRPALALRWMRLQGTGMPPMAMARLMAECDLPRRTDMAIRELVALKYGMSEAGVAGRTDPAIDALIRPEDEAAAAWLATAPGTGKPTDLADRADAMHRRHVLAIS